MGNSQAANLLFASVSRRYERGSIIVTSNRSFEQWAEILGDAIVAAALIDRLVHHATMVPLKGKSYRLRQRSTKIVPAAQVPPLGIYQAYKRRGTTPVQRGRPSPSQNQGLQGFRGPEPSRPAALRSLVPDS
jgi:hypothetical protein